MSIESTPASDDGRAQPVAWRLLIIPAVAQLLLHVVTSGRYGIFRDEYYYLACAARPAWGYVDQPPLSIWVLGVWRSVFGDSVQSLRILPALCGSGLIVLAGILAAQMGGRRWAQVLAALAVAVGGSNLVLGGNYSMNAFDVLFWVGAYLLLARIVRTGEGRWWPWLGLVVGVGLLNKIGLVIFGLALAIGLIVTAHRRHLADRRLWFAGGLAVLFLVPYALWNAAHDWPTVEFIQNAKRYKISDLSPLEFVGESVLDANPLTLPLWLGGLTWLMLARRARRFRILGVMFVLTLAILIVQASKPYYLASSFPVLMAAGGVAWEGWTDAVRWRWARWLLVANLVVAGVAIAPMTVPILSPAGLHAYQQRLGLVPKTGEVGHTSTLPQYFSDRLGWEELARTVAGAYARLSKVERAQCVVLARNYGQAGAVEYWSRKYDLPPVACPHNNYWFWGIPRDSVAVVIAIKFDRELLGEWFDDVTEGGRAETPYALESRLNVWICRGARRPLAEVWPSINVFI